MSKTNLNTPKTLVLQKFDVSNYEIIQVLDNRKEKVVNAFVLLGNEEEEEQSPRCFNLWKESAYDEIGQWTDEQVNAKVAELIAAL